MQQAAKTTQCRATTSWIKCEAYMRDSCLESRLLDCPATHFLAPELRPSAHDTRQPTIAIMAHEGGLQPNTLSLYTYRCKSVLAPLLLALPSLLVLGAASLKLVSNGLLTLLLGLLPVDGLHQHTLVLEHVTLDLQCQHLHLKMLLDCIAHETPADQCWHNGSKIRSL